MRRNALDVSYAATICVLMHEPPMVARVYPLTAEAAVCADVWVHCLSRGPAAWQAGSFTC